MNIEIGDVVLADVYIGVVKGIDGTNITIASNEGIDKVFDASEMTVLTKVTDLVKMFLGGVMSV